METNQSNSDVSTPKPPLKGRLVPGVLLLLPSLFCCISQLLLPTVSTFLMSFQKVSPVKPEGVYVGLDNYTHLFGSNDFWPAAGFTLIMLLARLLVVALVPLLLAWAVGQFGRPLRLGLRALFTLPVVFFVPIAIAVTWLEALNPSIGLFHSAKSWLASPASARVTLVFVDTLYLFGLAGGLGLVVYLPVWRRAAGVPQPTFKEVLKPMLVTWALGILGITALTLCVFSLNFALTNGGPAGSTTTLGILLYQFAFRHFSMGPAAAVASLILLVSLALGTIAGLLIIWTRLRLDLVETKPVLEKADRAIAPKRSQVLPGIVLTLLILLSLGACLFSALPFGWLMPQAFGKNGLESILGRIAAGQVFINSFAPPLVAAALQVLIAYLAALSIGALQPFGKRSEWLLLLFSPWLFVTVLPLSLVNFMADQKAGMLNTFWGSLSPILFSIPALFILTLFFAGRAAQLQRRTTGGESQAAPDFFKHFILPSLPLSAVLWLLIAFFNGQEVFWPLLMNTKPERLTLSLSLLQTIGMFANSGEPAAALLFLILPACVFFFICLAFFQIFYLDRLTLYTENLVDEKAAQNPEQG